MPAKFSDPLLEKVLGPMTVTPFRTDGDKGSGAVGRKIERVLDVANQNQPGKPDDTSGELKTLNITKGLSGKTMTICTLTEKEYDNPGRRFVDSVVFNKMKSLLVVYYSDFLGKKTGSYIINRWSKADLHYLDKIHWDQVVSDYQTLMPWVKKSPYSALTKGMKVPRTKYLTITWCGVEGSIHPVWKFKNRFVRILYGDSANPTIANEFDRMFTSI